MKDLPPKKPGANPSSAPLKQQDPITGSPWDQAEFLDIQRQLEAGTLTPERARAKIMALYQVGLGSWVRGLGETFPDVASDVKQRVLKDMALILSDAPVEHTERARLSPTASATLPFSQRLKNKTTDVLKREAIVLNALLSTDLSRTFAEVHAKIKEVESDIPQATVTANLDRMIQDAVIARPRKGHYAASPTSRDYHTALKHELEARGETA